MDTQRNAVQGHHSVDSKRFNQSLIIPQPYTVKIPSNLPCLHWYWIVRTNHWQQPVGQTLLRRQPCTPLFRIQDNRHPVVDRLHECVCRRGNNAAGLDRFCTLRKPCLPQTRKRHRVARLQTYIPRLFDSVQCWPLKEAWSRNNAPPRLECTSEGRLFCNRLATRIVEIVANSFILSPTRNKTPAHFVQMPVPLFISSDRVDSSWRRDVPRGQQIDLAGNLKMLGELLRILVQGEATTHIGKSFGFGCASSRCL